MKNKDRCAKRGKTAMLKDKRQHTLGRIILVLLLLSLFLTPSCNPEAPWSTDNVTINMNVTVVSSGFIECTFSTNKEAYYFIACEPVEKGIDPIKYQKAFMTLALDSAYSEYLLWRNHLLKKGELNIASFSSHSLQYGNIDYFFTGLLPSQDYWVYAFVVDPQTQKPAGKLYLQQITTKSESIMEVHFDYRIKGYWDYIYPLDTFGNICSRFPYIATTADSATLAEEDSVYTEAGAVWYFVTWCMNRFRDPSQANILYGVHAVENDGWTSSEYFEEGHTYYTAICGYDGSFKHTTIYKFLWTGDSCNYYYHDTDSANIINLLPGTY